MLVSSRALYNHKMWCTIYAKQQSAMCWLIMLLTNGKVHVSPAQKRMRHGSVNKSFPGYAVCSPTLQHVEMLLCNVILPEAPPTADMSQTQMTKPSHTVMHRFGLFACFFYSK